jgi:hypothetical protein
MASWLLVAMMAVFHPAAPLVEPSLRDGWDRPVPSLELSSAFFAAGANEVGGRRNVLAFVLRAETAPSAYNVSYGAALGWLTLSQLSHDAAEASLRTSGVSNALLFANFHLDFRPGVTAQVGLGLAIGMTTTSPEPYRRVVRVAYGHGIAMQGVWDAWLWAPERGGFVLPGRLTSAHAVGPWHGRARAEAVLIFTLPESESGETDLGRVVQLGADYALWPRRWLAAGGRYHFVWFPSATLFHTQSSVVPYTEVILGRWRLSGEAVLNLGRPYGFGGGQHIWAAWLKAGVWL